MQSMEEYMQGLKQWLQDTKDSPLEEMSDFFTKRLQGYEEHMLVWEESYRIFAEILPLECRKILDLGCGTGLELDRIWRRDPDIEVTGVDLCQSMLDKLYCAPVEFAAQPDCRPPARYFPGSITVNPGGLQYKGEAF